MAAVDVPAEQHHHPTVPVVGARVSVLGDLASEFGLDDEGRLYLIDEVLTPDSSRFWPLDSYRPGISPPSFDKQFVRDYLETLDWDKTAPGPELPPDILGRSAEKYREALRQLTAEQQADWTGGSEPAASRSARHGRRDTAVPSGKVLKNSLLKPEPCLDRVVIRQ